MPDLTLTPMRLVQPEGKKYHRLEFEEDFTIGPYSGNVAMVWGTADFLAKVKGQVSLATLSPATKDPTWAPTLDKLTNTTTGEVVYEKQASDGGYRGSKSGAKRTDGDWETAMERAQKNASIEAQVVVKAAVEWSIASKVTDPLEVCRVILLFGESAAQVRKAAGFELPKKTAPASEAVATNGGPVTPRPDDKEWKEAYADAMAAFGTEARIQLAYKRMYGEVVASVNDIDVTALVNLTNSAMEAAN